METITITKCKGCKWSINGEIGCNNPKETKGLGVVARNGFFIGCEHGYEAKPISLVDKIAGLSTAGGYKKDVIKTTLNYLKEHIEELIDCSALLENLSLDKSTLDALKQSIKDVL